MFVFRKKNPINVRKMNAVSAAPRSVAESGDVAAAGKDWARIIS